MPPGIGRNERGMRDVVLTTSVRLRSTQCLSEGSLPCSIAERTGVAVVTRLLSSSDLESDCVTPRGSALQFFESMVHLHPLLHRHTA